MADSRAVAFAGRAQTAQLGAIMHQPPSLPLSLPLSLQTTWCALILELHPLLELFVLHNLLHLRARLAVQVDALELLPSRVSDDKVWVVVLDPLHLNIAVLLPLLLLFQPLLQVPVMGLI